MVFVLSVRSSRPRTFRILLFFGVDGRGISYTSPLQIIVVDYIIIKTCASPGSPLVPMNNMRYNNNNNNNDIGTRVTREYSRVSYIL